MSQATKFGAPLEGPKAPAAVTAQIDDSLNALLTGHLGSTRPEYLEKFGVWTQQVDVNNAKLKMFNGNNDVELLNVNTSNGDVTIPALKTKVLDAEKLDGVDGSKFGRRDLDNTWSALQTFNKAVEFKNTIYTGNNAVVFNDADGPFADRSGTNIDHIWHDDNDSTYGGSWNFVSDGTYKSTGNSLLRAGAIQLNPALKTHTNESVYAAQIDHKEPHIINLTANRTHVGLNSSSHINTPENASGASGTRLSAYGGLLNSTMSEGSLGEGYVFCGANIKSHKRSTQDLRYLRGAYHEASTVAGLSSGTVAQVSGTYTYVNLDGDDTVTTAFGHRIHFNPDSGTGHTENAYGLQIYMDRDAQTITNKVALDIEFDGDWGEGERYGIYAGDCTKHYLTGKLEVTGDVTALSDVRTKTDIETIPDALKLVMGMRGVNFTKDDKRCSGVIAQELQKVMPEVVSEGENGMLSVAYGNLAGVLIEACKDLAGQVTELRRDLEQLRS
ncbi:MULTISPECIES: tail fiber domain-containing protein [unclassified Pseudovibrio]|uniref:tail fiber domain-containing protein n=1 Tax=unclassified Pseudovibrio TaxID=2627060 RepID=UPI0007AE3899|nr:MULTISPECIES: tail fiber domain-containing protein [unclassified Pseudovibrio]KZK92572.1 hypothetical protein PsW74_05499 [Pseudovibrio sp. W74]KZL10384.1 hypothetical protein PsAD14_01291 [Pseudovibrio sp. Ad14]